MTFARRTLTVLILLSLVGAVLTTAPRDPGPAGPPIPMWGTFEVDGLARSGWTAEATDPNSVAVSEAQARSGTRSLRVDDRSTAVGASARHARFDTRPGRTHHVGAWAYPVAGGQLVRINWYDEGGDLVGRSEQTTTDADQVWQRVSLAATAVEGARQGELEIVSGSTGRSTVWWDDITVLTSQVPNGGFESGSSFGDVPSWSPASWGHATVGRSEERSHTGDASLEMHARAGSTASATSSLLQVEPSIAYRLRAWVRPISGDASVTVTWYNSAKQPIRQRTVPVNAPEARWSALSAPHVVAPTDARYASLRPQASGEGGARIHWDDVSLTPAPPAPTPTFTTTSLGSPLDTRTRTKVTATMVIDGRPKLATVASSLPAQLQVVDIQSNRVETVIELPGLSSGEALAVGQDGRLYIGGNDDSLYRFTPGSSSVEDLGPVTDSATHIFDLEVGPDGAVWGGTYPDGALWRLDPRTDEFTDFGRVRQGADYARSIAIDDHYAYIGVGSTNPEIVRVNLVYPTERTTIDVPVSVTSGVITELELLGRFLLTRTPAGTTKDGRQHASDRQLYDIARGTWQVPVNVAGQSPSPVDSNGYFYYVAYGHLWAVDSATGAKTSVTETTVDAGRDRHVLRTKFGSTRGEWLLTYDPETTSVDVINLSSHVERSYRVTFDDAPMAIKSLDAGVEGKVYVGGFGGASLAIVDPATGATTTHPDPSPPPGAAVIGEVEGSISHGRYQYIGTYTNAKIFRYDTTQPWVDGSNPELVTALGDSHGQDRPGAWAAAGERVFFGTVPAYGLLGGGLGIIEDDGDSPRFIRNIVQDQSVVSLAAKGDIVFGGTSRWGGLGAEPTTNGAKVFAYNAETGEKEWEVAPRKGAQSFGAVTIGPNGNLWAWDGGTLFELDPLTGETLRSLTVDTRQEPDRPTYRNGDLVRHEGYLYLQTGRAIYAVDPVIMRLAVPVTSGISVPQMAISDNQLLYPSGHALMKLTTL